MNFPKGLLEYKKYNGGAPWILEQIRRCFSYKCSEIIIVLGYHSDEYLSLFKKLISEDEYWHLLPEIYSPLKKHLSKIHLAINQSPHLGQFSSLQTGLQKLNNLSNIRSSIYPLTMITPIDVPLPSIETINALIECKNENEHEYEHEKKIDAIIPTFNGKGGHPILIGNDLINYILKFDLSDPHNNNIRLDKILQNSESNNFTIKKIATNDPTVTLNLNTFEKWNDFITEETKKS
ncbi:MAG: NTP transferase domain-containing protein [Oligoflexia bacterium]|nr:NTP transferase domain-containing protein [Oligoflexia bacterium]